MTHPRKVLHIISRLDAGSAGHHLRLLTRDLPYACEVVSLAPAGPSGTALRSAGTPVHELPAHADGDLRAALRLRRLIRHGDFDVVHTHLRRAGALGRVAARLAGVPSVVATEHSLRDLPPRPLERAGERLGRITIAVSPAIAGRLRDRGLPDSRIVVIPRGIDAGEFRFDAGLRSAARARLGIAPGAPVIGAVGRLEPGKRLDLLIRAIGAVPGATLLLVGDGPARTALHRLAAIEGVTGRVVFAGAVPHAREMLCAMDVFAAPGGRDPDGPAVLEAMAAGLPAVYTACAPLDDLAAARRTVAGTHRLSRDPESLPRTLRAEMLCLAERDGRRLPVRVLGGRYDAARTAAAVGRLYERLADRRRPARAPVKPRAAG